MIFSILYNKSCSIWKKLDVEFSLAMLNYVVFNVPNYSVYCLSQITYPISFNSKSTLLNMLRVSNPSNYLFSYINIYFLISKKNSFDATWCNSFLKKKQKLLNEKLFNNLYLYGSFVKFVRFKYNIESVHD